MWRETVTAAAAVVLAGMLAACGPEEKVEAPRFTPASVLPDQPVAPAAPAFDAKTCANIEAQRDVNRRLAADGYADDYSAQYDSLAKAAGCP